jgi:ATP-dependent DNA ligase
MSSTNGFRVIARKIDERVRLYSRPRNDLTARFPRIVEALARLRARSCVIDGEAVSCGDDGIASFERMRDWRHGDSVFLWAFDLIELNGDDLRRDPLAVRKATLASLVGGASVEHHPRCRKFRRGEDAVRAICAMQAGERVPTRSQHDLGVTNSRSDQF